MAFSILGKFPVNAVSTVAHFLRRSGGIRAGDHQEYGEYYGV